MEIKKQADNSRLVCNKLSFGPRVTKPAVSQSVRCRLSAFDSMSVYVPSGERSMLRGIFFTCSLIICSFSRQWFLKLFCGLIRVLDVSVDTTQFYVFTNRSGGTLRKPRSPFQALGINRITVYYREVFMSRKNCKTCENTGKSPTFLLVPVCGEHQIKQVKNYKWVQVHIQTCETHSH